MSELVSVYDPIGLISPSHLIGKILYGEVCELKIPWDEVVPLPVKQKWDKWMLDIETKVEIPRSIPLKQESVTMVDLHVFGDASVLGCCAAAYVVVYQPSSLNQGLIASKSRLSKRDMNIPRLELIAPHMATNLAVNMKEALPSQNIRSATYWTDSIVILQWLKGKGCYKVFVANRISKILEREFIAWKYVPTKQNPADIGDDDYRMNTYHTHLDDVNMSIFGLRFAKKGLCDVRGVDAVSEEFQVMFRKWQCLCLKSKNPNMCHFRGVHTANASRLKGVLFQVCTRYLACILCLRWSFSIPHAHLT